MPPKISKFMVVHVLNLLQIDNNNNNNEKKKQNNTNSKYQTPLKFI